MGGHNPAESVVSLQRNEWSLCGGIRSHPKGAVAAAFYYSLIETAKANGLRPYDYLRYLFDKLPLAETKDDYRKLLPQNLNQQMITPARPA
jgi:transposase